MICFFKSKASSAMRKEWHSQQQNGFDTHMVLSF